MADLCNKKILQFFGRNRFLSNFFIEPDGSCVEVEYQRAKCRAPEEAALFDAKGLGPGQAKRLGRQVRMWADWEVIKLSIMEKLVLAKFTDHSELAALLLQTRDIELIEGNTWGDRFWGMVNVNGVWEGQNHLGKILMRVREQVRKVQTCFVCSKKLAAHEQVTSLSHGQALCDDCVYLAAGLEAQVEEIK